MAKSKVYFSKSPYPDTLVKLYKANVIKLR